MSVIPEWLRQGRKVRYKALKQLTPLVLTARVEGKPILNVTGEGALLAGVISFDHPFCGLRVILDDGDTETWLRLDRMFALSMVLPQEFFWLSRYDTINNFYVAMATHERYFSQKCKLIPFNDDAANHNLIGFGIVYIEALR